ncbi:MAG: hypothetical protein EZS28_040346, partial [Streblomastix strix]
PPRPFKDQIVVQVAAQQSQQQLVVTQPQQPLTQNIPPKIIWVEQFLERFILIRIIEECIVLQAVDVSIQQFTIIDMSAIIDRNIEYILVKGIYAEGLNNELFQPKSQLNLPQPPPPPPDSVFDFNPPSPTE